MYPIFFYREEVHRQNEAYNFFVLFTNHPVFSVLVLGALFLETSQLDNWTVWKCYIVINLDLFDNFLCEKETWFLLYSLCNCRIRINITLYTVLIMRMFHWQILESPVFVFEKVSTILNRACWIGIKYIPFSIPYWYLLVLSCSGFSTDREINLQFEIYLQNVINRT